VNWLCCSYKVSAATLLCGEAGVTQGLHIELSDSVQPSRVHETERQRTRLHREHSRTLASLFLILSQRDTCSHERI